MKATKKKAEKRGNLHVHKVRDGQGNQGEGWVKGARAEYRATGLKQVTGCGFPANEESIATTAECAAETGPLSGGFREALRGQPEHLKALIYLPVPGGEQGGEDLQPLAGPGEPAKCKLVIDKQAEIDR